MNNKNNSCEQVKKISVGVVGHTWRLWQPLVEILKNHSFADIGYTKSRQEWEKGDLGSTQCLFLSLPYGESKEFIESHADELKGKKLIDLSIDYRSNPEWTYGLVEVYREKILNATKICNPWCYATSIALGLFPLKGNIKNVFVASSSWYSGAGTQKPDSDDIEIYKAGDKHQHLIEIKQTLEIENILFVPEKVNTLERGLVSKIFVECNEEVQDVIALYKKVYADSSCVRVRCGEDIKTRNIVGTNFCDIQVLPYGKNVVIISALDNLIKGGSGQAIQNFNLMYGFDENMWFTKK